MNQLPDSLAKYDHHAMGDAIYFPGITNHEYHNSPGVSSSTIRKFGESEIHALHQEIEDTPALRFGSAAHSYIIEGEKAFAQEIAVVSGSPYSASHKQLAAELKEKGITTISNDQYNTIREMSEALLPIGDKLLHPDETEYPSEHFNYPYERALYWWEDDILCKLKADVIRHPIEPVYNNNAIIIVDYKTTQSCHPDSFVGSIKKYGYQHQAAWYKRGFEKAGFDVREFVFVAQEKTSPYASKVFKIKNENFDKYWTELDYMLGLYRNSLDSTKIDLQTYNCPDIIEIDL